MTHRVDEELLLANCTCDLTQPKADDEDCKINAGTMCEKKERRKENPTRQCNGAENL